MYGAAGNRTVKVTFSRATLTESDSGQELEGWSDIGAGWAEVFYGRGDERRQAAMQQGLRDRANPRQRLRVTELAP